MTNRIFNPNPAVEFPMGSVWIEGTLLEDPEVGLSDAGNAMCFFQIGAQRILPVQNEFHVFRVEARPSVLESCSSRLHKGRGIRLIGRLHRDRWTDRSGQSHCRIKIVSEMIEARPNFSQLEISSV